MSDRPLSLRLPGHRSPVVVRLTAEQMAAVSAAAEGSPVSEWVRLGLDLARRSRTHAEAAEAAGLDLRTWIRVVTLSRCGVTDLCAQLRAASR